MTTAQKIIKYLAIAFAIFLIVTIISTILVAMYGFANVLGLRRNNNEVLGEMKIFEIRQDEVKRLDIEVAYTNLIIKTGESLKVETNNNKIECKKSNTHIQIKEKNRNCFSGNNEGNLIVYIPQNLEFEEVKIDAGAGKITIESLNTKNLKFVLGAGGAEIDNLNVTKDCEIDGGAGNINILSGIINNLDLDMGIGEVNLAATLEGKNDINAGIGNLNIMLQGNKEKYEIKTKQGLGSVKVDGREMENNQVFGDGENYIEIDGGMGSIKVDF